MQESNGKCCCCCDQSKPIVLVIGASGLNGRKIAQDLLQSGKVKVRLAVRDATKVADLVKNGATTINFDFNDPALIKAAFVGVSRAFLMSAVSFSWAPQIKLAVEAAKEAKVQHIVLLSGAGANAKGPYWIGREHGECEEHVKASGIPYTIIRPQFFMENWVNYYAQTIKQQSAIYAPCGDGLVPFVATADIAAVIAMILQDPAPEHIGKTFTLTGPKAYSASEVAAILSKIIGKTVNFINVPDEGYKASMMGMGIPEKLAQGLLELEIIKREGWAKDTTTDVKDILKRDPITLESFLEAAKSAFM